MVHISFRFMLMVLLIVCKPTYYKEKQKSFVVRYKQIGIDVNADGTKYMVISRDKDRGLSHNVKTDTSPFGRGESSNILEQTKIKFLFRKKLKTNRSRETLDDIRCRFFCV